MAIMVFSFRASLEDWLGGVVGADLFVRAAEQGDTFFTPDEQARVATLPGVARMEAVRYDRLALGEAMLTLVARPMDRRILEGFRAEPLGWPVPEGIRPAWVSEAARDLHGWKAGDRITLPLAGRGVEWQVMGVIRDYARTWGAVMVPLDAYREATGDGRANDLALHLAEGADAAAVQRAVRDALPRATGLAMEDATGIRTRSLAIFDRSFAVTYALEAIAILIGLAGVTSSFAALAWSRRREFGVLRFLGLTRQEILRMLSAEGAAAGILGAAIGLVAGTAISFVLVHVVNRQSFHWSIELHWPLAGIAVLLAAIVATCAAGARASAALAVRHEAVLAVKDDA
jgi:putative ABC transport system permease protein